MSLKANTKFKQAQRLYKAGKTGDALVLYQKLLQREPDNGELHHVIGRALYAANQLQEAAFYLGRAISLGVRSAAVFADLAETLNKLGRYQEADSMARAAVTLDPDHQRGLQQLALSLFAQGQYDQALGCAEQLAARSPGNAADWILIARINAGAGRYPQAISYANQAIAQDPTAAEACYLLCQAYLNLQRWDDALAMIDRALALAPGNPAFITMQATVLEYQGQYEQAYALLQPLLANDQRLNATGTHLYARLARRFGKQQHALALLENLAQEGSQPVSLRNVTLNLLGATCDELGQYDRAFAAFDEANRIRPSRYNDARQEAFIQAIMAWFSRERLQAMAAASHDSRRPIFIVGMPRSGTSLTENILARHPGVHAGGELVHIPTIANTLLPEWLDSGAAFPACLDGLTPAAADRAAGYYLDQLASLASNAETRVTDKMPMNFMYLGLIAKLFPQARIIHCSRDPLDTGLSCYFANFASVDDMGFSQDLDAIGRYYKRYGQLMAHWRQVLPVPIHELTYEALVSRPDEEIRRLLAFCELPWHDDCLSPHKAEQAVRTVSYNQVRQPINTRSIGRWRHYEKHLQPLKEALGLA